nr:hypothetical protein GCM10020241_45830 [Streptoalloteichus tenebrarius]
MPDLVPVPGVAVSRVVRTNAGAVPRRGTARAADYANQVLFADHTPRSSEGVRTEGVPGTGRAPRPAH